MTEVDLSKLPDYLARQRWFGSKGVPIKGISLVDHVAIEVKGDSPCAGRSVIAVIEVTYELGARERYQLHVCSAPDGSVVPALEFDDHCRELLRICLEKRAIPSGTGMLRGEAFAGSRLRLERISPSARVRRLTEEQSNTSLVFDDQAILKVIRRIEPGLNPELEIGRFLSAHPSFKSAPALLGAIELEGPASATLAVVHEYLQAESDGWKHVLAQFRQHPVPGEGLLQEFFALGKVVGDLHLTFASDPSDPAFAPEPIQQVDLQRWSSSIIGELGVTFAEAEERVPDLAQIRARLVEKAKRLGQVAPSGMKTRVHGDLHLGQVLRVSGEWMIFDFEGEPARSFNQRREKFAPLKDVAGMLRSLSYAQAAVELEGATPGDRASPCRRAFLEGYLQVTAPSPLLPVGEAFDAVLEGLELERTIYELRYELHSRPDWVPIPVRSLRELGKAA